MQVFKSTFEFDGPPQRDGSQWVRDRHALGDGTTRDYYYLLAPGDDPSVIMADHAAAIEAESAGDDG